MTDFGVDGVSEINRRRVTRQDDDLALGSEGVNLFGVEVNFQRGKKFIRIGDITLPLDHLPQPCQPLLILRGDRAIFIFPVRRDSFFRHAVHLFGADLDFEARAIVGDH